VDAHAIYDLHDLPRQQLQPPLIERDDQLRVADSLLAQARAASGSLLTIQGAGGLGKSALLRAVCAMAVDERAEVLSATGREFERDFALGLVLQLFEDQVALAGEEERASLLSGVASQAAPLFVPGARERISDPSFTLLHGLYWLCGNLARRRPLLLAVDNADLADEASLRFLLFLAERLDDLPVMLAITFGAAPRRVAPPLLESLVRHPAAIGVRVHAFSADATARYLRETWLPDAEPGVLSSAHEATGGSPYLAGALGAELAEGGPDAVVSRLGPSSVAAVALRRAEAVDADGPALMRAVAILGPAAELRHAAELAGIEREDAARIADDLIETGLLAHSARLSTAQPVTQVAVASSLGPLERAEAHLRAAELLAREHAPPESIARHLAEAPRRHSPWVVETLRGAAASAVERGAPGDAVGWLRRALAEPPPQDEHARVMLDLGRAEATAGEAQAVGRLREAGELIADSRERAQTALDSGRTLFAFGRHADAAAAFERGLLEVGDTDDALAGRLQASLATLGRLLDPAAAVAGESLAPPAAGDTPAGRALLALSAMEAALRGDPRDKVHDLAACALGRGALLQDETADGIAYYLASLALLLAEDLQGAEIALTAAVEDARSRGSVLGFATASFVRSTAILRRGRLADAAADARSALAAERQGWWLAVPAARVVLAECLLEAGDPAGAERELNAAAGVASSEEMESGSKDAGRIGLLVGRGHLRLRRGEPEAALADFRACGDELTRIGARSPAIVPWRSNAARALAAMRDVTEARRLVEEELAIAEVVGTPGPIGHAYRVLGQLTMGTESLEAFEYAAQRLEESQAALERARALVDYGAALRRSGRRHGSREPLRRGLDLAQRCGANALAARAMGEVRLTGARPRRTALEGPESLTEREREVATLAAEGLSNREIAESLVVTMKTVEWHLRHAFRKLGIDSREKLGRHLG
jgi:DNA-binding CsgD family transcriptional regulator/tetratricopeptide (TPR) repeat protein